MGLQITKDNYDRWAWQQRAVINFHFHNSKFQAAQDPIQVGHVNFKTILNETKKCDWLF